MEPSSKTISALSVLAVVGLGACERRPPDPSPSDLSSVSRYQITTHTRDSIDDHLRVTLGVDGPILLDVLYPNVIPDATFEGVKGDQLHIQEIDTQCGAAYAAPALYLVNLDTGEEVVLAPEVPAAGGRDLRPNCTFLDTWVVVSI